MPAHVMKSWRPPAGTRFASGGRIKLRQNGSTYFDVIEKRNLPRARPGPIEPIQRRYSARQPGAGGQQQQKSQQDRNIEGNRAERVQCDDCLLLRPEAGIVGGPCAFISESEALAQDVRID